MHEYLNVKVPDENSGLYFFVEKNILRIHYVRNTIKFF